MTDRRISNLGNGEHQSKLKTIAGLIKSLSYMEMMELAGLIKDDMIVGDIAKTRVAEGLVKISDCILTKKEA